MSKDITIPDETITSKIYLIREQKVMVDSDLAELYQVQTKLLKRQVRRNKERFPDDFMFELTKDEFDNLRSQFGTSRWGGSRYTPIVFSEKFFVQLTPIFKMNDFNNERNDRFEQEVFASYSVNPKMQVTGFYSGKFEDENHTVSAGLTIFF